jgi:hypothetical protein
MKSRWLLRLYPRVWRDRYGDEFLSLLESRPLGATQIIDIVRSSFSEHLRGGVNASRVGVHVRTVLGWYFLSHVIWWGVTSLGGDGPGARAWTMDALLLSAVLQVRVALLTVGVIFTVGAVLSHCSDHTSRGVVDWLRFFTAIAVAVCDRLLYHWLGIGPSPAEIAATFGGGAESIGPGIATLIFVSEWAIRPLRLRYRALA